VADVPGARLIMIGDGPERQRLGAAVAAAGLSDRIALTGTLPRSEVMRWLHAADAALLSSAWENFPHAAVEALAVGTPVVATAVGGVPEVIESGVNGMLAPAGDAGALAQAMRAVTTDAALSARLRAGAAETAGRFGVERIYAAIERELVAAVGDGNQPRRTAG
jgi:glycosyltransferase involved in cell wall biosynthesis